VSRVSDTSAVMYPKRARIDVCLDMGEVKQSDVPFRTEPLSASPTVKLIAAKRNLVLRRRYDTKILDDLQPKCHYGAEYVRYRPGWPDLLGHRSICRTGSALYMDKSDLGRI